MQFNHFPVDKLTGEQQKLLQDIESHKLTLHGANGQELIFDPADIHSNYLKNIIIDDNTTEYDVGTKESLITNLQHMQQVVEDQIKANNTVVASHSVSNQNANGNCIVNVPNGLQAPYPIANNTVNHGGQQQGQVEKADNKELEMIIDDITPIIDSLKKDTYLPDSDCFGYFNKNNRELHICTNCIDNYAQRNKVDANSVLAYTYIGLLFEVFFYIKANEDNTHYVREIETPINLCGILLFLQKNGYKQIYDQIKKINQNQGNGYNSIYGFGLYLNEETDFVDNEHQDFAPEKIVYDYATKCGNLDPDSIDIIKYTVGMMKGHSNTPSKMPNEFERTYFALLVMQILNVSQYQELSFCRLFEQIKQDMKRSLLEKWEPKDNRIDQRYRNQLEDIIDKTVSENILVESMAPWQSAKQIYDGGLDYTSLIADTKMLRFLPYQHQVNAWDSLIGLKTKYKSMVITTGTGSGKTEAFMVPLISDIDTQQKGLKAIFLYPLNALMEDQKEKMSKMIEASGRDITFAVYNGATPEGDKDTSIHPLKHEVIYREEIRGEKWDSNNQCWKAGGRIPDIILTNPTMLEYMLLRKADEAIISTSQQLLSWFVIDETHTYCGAGADELAMLIRRVLKAFDRNPNDIHFATSSATVGNSDESLMNFITGITGQDNNLIDIIKGKRTYPSFSLAQFQKSNDKVSLLANLYNSDYLYLKDLIPYKNDTDSRLKELDRLCEGGLKVKVHFFAEALTNGIYANLEDAQQQNAIFNVKTDIPLDRTTCNLDKRYMRVYRCTKCGHFLLGVDYKQTGTSYECLRTYNPSGFVGIDYGTKIIGGNVLACNVSANNKLDFSANSRGHVLLTLDQTCPYCGVSNETQWQTIRPFNVTSAKTLRAIMPTLLNEAKENGSTLPYNGRQLISFADSRKGAAESSMEQNIETERRWVVSTILDDLIPDYKDLWNKINGMKGPGNPKNQEYDQDLKDLDAAHQNNDKSELCRLAAKYHGTPLSWQDTMDLLYKNDKCDQLAACFAKRDDKDAKNGVLTEEYKKRFVLAALYNVMKKRSKEGFSPESYGILKTHYTKLDGITKPNDVDTLNQYLKKYNFNEIQDEDWRNYLKLYLDFHVRTDEDLFFMSGTKGWDTLDIKDCRNLKTDEGKRRSIKDPKKEKGLHYKLLWRLFGCDDETQLAKIDNQLPGIVDKVVDAMWNQLINIGIIAKGQTYYNDRWNYDVLTSAAIKDNRTVYRLNVNEISFCLFDGAYRDDNVKAIIDTTFMGHSPYQGDFKKNKTTPIQITNWCPPYPTNEATLTGFYKKHNAEYLKCQNTLDIYCKKDMFIQYEHTAQVGRELTKSRIQDFKDHKINVLACSTTMEMGVDIGELEIVSMSNVPPHPANYKQRAGRAGRAFQNKSFCLTMCNSDAVGSAVMENPKLNMLEREIITPTANLNSPQVVQRHINSFLMREFLKTLHNPFPNVSIKNYWIVDFFIDRQYTIRPRNKEGRKYLEDNNNGNAKVFPDQYAKTFHNNSLYLAFEQWLLNLNQKNNPQIWNDLDKIKANTIIKNVSNNSLIDDAKDALNELYHTIESELSAIQQQTSGLSFKLNQNGILSNKFEARLNYEFTSILCQNLLEYCSTHQFTPNANMPVNIVSLKIQNDDNLYNYDNPSRDLVIALSEYAPGQSVTINGNSYIVAGVDWDKSHQSFSRVHKCGNCNYAWIGQKGSQCPSCGSSKTKTYDMIEPTAFLVDNETSRIIDKDQKLAKIDAYMVGTNGLRFNSLTTLCDYATEAPNATTQILYLNDGLGYGFCVCKDRKCGRSVAETTEKALGGTKYLKDLMYYDVERIRTKNGQQVKVQTTEHTNLQDGKPDLLNINNLMRNMLIGGSIQTNFSILKTYHWENGAKTIFGAQQTDRAILTTLGLLICEELALEIPCQRQDIDFLITSLNNGHNALCIYDTAKGGAGYSSNLDANMWKLILGRCTHRLWDIIIGKKSIDSMFSRMTMRYLEEIDILATYKWLMEEFNARTLVPHAVTTVYQGATRSSITDIFSALKQAKSATLFVQPDYNVWNYELQNSPVPSWKETRIDFRLKGQTKTMLAFCGDPGVIPTEAVDIIKHSEDWATFGQADPVTNGIYPLAYINGWLYMTDDASTANYDGLWACGDIYAVQTTQPKVTPFNPTLADFSEFFIGPSSTLNSSKELLNLFIKLDNKKQISQFIKNAKGHKLEFIYMDEHLKSQLGTIMAIQLIEALAQQAGCNKTDFSVVFRNEDYFDGKGFVIDDNDRKLTGKKGQFQSVVDCNLMINRLLQNSNWNYKIDSMAHNTLPHWRCLTVKDLDRNSTLTIKPHGGVANGWRIDTDETRRRGVYFNTRNSNMTSDIPLISEDNKSLQCSIGMR